MKQKRISIMTIRTYKYEWKTADEVIANMHTTVVFPTSYIGTVAKWTGVTNPDTYRKAHDLWLKLKDAFNAEAATYEPEAHESVLGSIGKVGKREVLRTSWWYKLSEYAEEEASDIISIIELLHYNEKLETGRILFGS